MYDVPPPAAPGFYSPSAPRFKDATSFPDRSVGKLAVAPERHPDADERKLIDDHMSESLGKVMMAAHAGEEAAEQGVRQAEDDKEEWNPKMFF